MSPSIKQRLRKASGLVGALLVGVVTIGCGGDDLIVPEKTEPPLEVVTGQPSLPLAGPTQTTVAVTGYVVALDGIGADTIVGTTIGAVVINNQQVQPLEVWDDLGVAALETGRIHALLRRQENVLVAAEHGVFHTVDNKLVPSPANEALAGIAISAMAGAGAGEQEALWFGASDGLYHLKGDSLERWNIGGQGASPTALWAEPERLFAAYGDRFYVLDLAGRSAVEEALDFGTIHALQLGAGDLLYLATDHGLFERDSAGSYRQFTLSDGTAAIVDDLVFDPKDGTYVVANTGLFEVAADGQLMGVSTLAERASPRVAAGDDFGTLWVGDEERLTGMVVGTPISFEADAKPVIAQYCMTCHAAPGSNNAPAIALDQYEVAVARKAEVTQRVATGQMPPASSEALPVEALQLLLRWYASGVNP